MCQSPPLTRWLTCDRLLDPSPSICQVAWRLMHWNIWSQYVPPVTLKQRPNQCVVFPQLQESFFSRTRVATHIKHVDRSQFSISSIDRLISFFRKSSSPIKRKRQWEWNKDARGRGSKIKDKDNSGTRSSDARKYLSKVFPLDYFPYRNHRL